MVFTDKQQCYKTFLSEFDDSKASILGDYLPTSWAWTLMKSPVGLPARRLFW